MQVIVLYRYCIESESYSQYCGNFTVLRNDQDIKNGGLFCGDIGNIIFS